MDIFYSPRFRRRYRKLPAQIKDRVAEVEPLFRRDPFHPRLKTHKLGGALKDLWAFSVDEKYRIRFHSVGDHSIYDQAL